MILPATHILFYYFQQQVLSEKLNSQEALDDDEMAETAKFKMKTFVGLIVFFVAQQWWFQKDLITLLIRNTMIARQQTQNKGNFCD
jgi:hypothetical protein